MSLKAYIKAIASYLPEKIEQNDKSKRLTKKTGIYERHIVGENECASDLAFNAAEKLFAQYNISRDSIDFIILCTQSPDYLLPTTACILQERLGLSKKCGAFDFNLGCSGYIYGLSIVKGLIETGQARQVLLLTAETYSKHIHSEDETVKPLFGDGASATLINAEQTEKDGIHSFVFGTDGSGAENLIVPAGGMRNPSIVTEQVEQVDDSGNKRTNYNLYMNGSEVSKFALEVVPSTVDAILKQGGLEKDEVDYYVFHQANKFMLDFLQQKCELQGLPFWNCPENCGNTVSCSIPLAIVQLLERGEFQKLDCVMTVGFGVGLSWAGCLVDLSKTM
ncbi:ketoacyl-ACP synthase III [Pelosinus sp. UFO1]|uniref:ketoacyl-ACP synthase III n=1 Tax=Pelosinus sp. UFO1 TaxID=484770 RepID=UPI0004D11A67|nr:ketoacyl-ACP synthase III [Pelosinus sp. UFO1]AIF53719.1 Beta-ketoacyl-acyl-carrier-protein synthase III [Pelosinus sp. UFO1]